MVSRVSALVAAAGQGTRLGAALPKAYVELQGQSLVERSVRAMLDSGVVDDVAVVVAASMEEHARNIFERAGLAGRVRFVHGSDERADSVWAGLQSIPGSEGIVLVHDAARALTPPAMIARVVEAAHAGAGAVIPVVPVADTIKRVADGTVVDTPDRATLRAVQTPQAFDLASLRAANEKYFSSSTRTFVATDDASLMEWYGLPVTTVDGDPMAFKITTPLDLTLANAVLTESLDK